MGDNKLLSGVTQERLKECLHYNKYTGLFTWLIRSANKIQVGDQAGWLESNGYIRITIDTKTYYAQRLAWIYEYNNWPNGIIDHKDTIRSNNWIDNLRDVSNAENSQNKIKCKRNNPTSLLGVSYDKNRDKFKAQIMLNGKGIFIGRYPTAIEAHQAYVLAKRNIHLCGTL